MSDSIQQRLAQFSPEQRQAALTAFERDWCPRHFYLFVRRSWKHVYGEEFIDGWHIAGLCYHLQALWEGNLWTKDGEPADTLICNLPPGTGKSRFASCLFPAWCWLNDPTAGLWFSSFGQKLCDRDSVDMRRLITSDWYRALWGDRFQLLDDANQVRLYRNTAGGWRLAASIASRIGFGEHPRLFLIDDPHDPEQAASELAREFVRNYWTNKISSRGIVKGVKKAIVAQRLHEDDLSGYVLDSDEPLVHYCVPMEYEPERKCVTRICYRDIDAPQEDRTFTVREKWEDPRTEPGELMWPQGMDEKKVAKLKKGLRRAHAIAGQLQQRPRAPEGDFFEAKWLEEKVPKPTSFKRAVRAWDKASSTGSKSDYTAGALLVDADGHNIEIADMKRGKWPRKKRDQLILRTARKDAEQFRDYVIVLEQEAGSGGKDAAQISAEQLRKEGFRVRIVRPTSKKEVRWEPLADGLAMGRVHLVEGKWNRDFVDEMLAAPNGRNDDQIDAAANGYSYLVKGMSRGKINRPLLGISEEDVEDFAKHAPENKRPCPNCMTLGCELCRHAGYVNQEYDEVADIIGKLGVDEEDVELGVHW